MGCLLYPSPYYCSEPRAYCNPTANRIIDGVQMLRAVLQPIQPDERAIGG